MKKEKLVIVVLVVSILGIGSNRLNGQTFSEIFRQNKTQKKYLIAQIAALQAYISYARLGYGIAHGGLSAVGTLALKELDLHTGYFNSLKIVKAEIKDYPEVVKTISLQETVVSNYQQDYRNAVNSGAFTTGELDYIRRVYARLLEDCSGLLNKLVMVTTDGDMEMTDGERVARINAIYKDMLDNYGFSKSFGGDIGTLAVARIKDKAEIRTAQALYSISGQ